MTTADMLDWPDFNISVLQQYSKETQEQVMVNVLYSKWRVFFLYIPYQL